MSWHYVVAIMRSSLEEPIPWTAWASLTIDVLAVIGITYVVRHIRRGGK